MAIEDRYTDLEPLRSTRSGDLFRATHIALGRSVQVCKISASDDEHLASIREQACTVAAMGHPNITAIIDADWDGDEPYYVMDNVLDATLRERLDEGPFSADAGLQLAIDLFSALLFVHDHGTTHGSVSPARIYFDASGAARLGDFGASAASADPSGRTIAVDTDAMAYLPFAILRDPSAYDASTDRHCAAAIVVHAMTGAPLESGGLIDIPGVPQRVVTALARLLEPSSLHEDLLAAKQACFDALHGSAQPAPAAAAAPADSAAFEPHPAAQASAPAPRQSTPNTAATDLAHATAALEQVSGRPVGGSTVIEPVELPESMTSAHVEPMTPDNSPSLSVPAPFDGSGAIEAAELPSAPPFAEAAARGASDGQDDEQRGNEDPTVMASGDAVEAAQAGSRVRDKLNKYAHLLQ